MFPFFWFLIIIILIILILCIVFQKYEITLDDIIHAQNLSQYYSNYARHLYSNYVQ